MPGILSLHRIALAGTQFGPLNYSPADVQRFITNAGGTYAPKLTSTCTILLTSDKAWATKAPPVITALKDKKYKDKVAVVTWDWLEDCVMKSKRCLQTKKYLWRKPEKKAKVGMLGEWRRPEQGKVTQGLVGGEKVKKVDVEGELRRGRYQVYSDKGIDYDISLTRGDIEGEGGLIERYRLCLYINTTTFKTKLLYATTLTYTSTIRAAKSEFFPITKSSKPTYLVEPGSNWATAYAALELFFQEKTGRAFHDVVDGGSRVSGKGWLVKAKGLVRLIDVEMREKGDEEDEDVDVEGVLDESEDEMMREVDDASEEQKGQDDQILYARTGSYEEEQTEMEIANAIKQQIVMEEEQMEETQQSTATRAKLTATTAEPYDSDSNLSTPPASETYDISAQNQGASTLSLATKDQHKAVKEET